MIRQIKQFNSFTIPTDSQTFNLEATASSGLSVSFSSSDTDVVTIDANTVTIFGVGTATNVVSIKTESSLNLKVVIYDINGRTLKEIDGYISNHLIDIANLSSGTYLIKVTSSKGEKMMKRLIKL